MKLVFAIVSNDDSTLLIQALIEPGIQLPSYQQQVVS